jgi:hypothetical protein
LNDHVLLTEAASSSTSLTLVHVGALRLHIFRTGELFGNPKRRVQARFRFSGYDYWLWVTDPIIERAYLSRPDGHYDLGECYLTVSLGEPFKDCCYKLVAAVIQRP